LLEFNVIEIAILVIAFKDLEHPEILTSISRSRIC
jgi:hypothetical protein